MVDETANQPTPVNQWRGRQGTPLTLPSGNVALVRSPGIQHFLKTGQIPNSLRNMIKKAMSSGGQQDKLEAVMEKEEDLVNLFDLFDKVLLQVVIEPTVLPVPLDKEENEIPLDERDMEAGIYVDEVDMEDKAFIFQYAIGGTKDLESFRQGQIDTMADVQSG